MITKVQKWGNSLALRIPKAFADTAKIENDSVVDVSFVNGRREPLYNQTCFVRWRM